MRLAFQRREPQTTSGVKKGWRILVAVSPDDMSDLDVSDLPGTEMLDDDGALVQLATFQRAYVDQIDENAGIISFTLAKPNKPHARTRCKGSLQLHDENVTWANGWAEETLVVLRATYNLSGES